MGVNHETYQDFNSPPNFGFWFIQGTGNSPNTNGTTHYYCINQGLGNNYSWTGANSYGLQIGIPRNVSNPYISIGYKENNVLGSWSKISAGQADTITTTQITTRSMTNNDTQSDTKADFGSLTFITGVYSYLVVSNSYNTIFSYGTIFSPTGDASIFVKQTDNFGVTVSQITNGTYPYTYRMLITNTSGYTTTFRISLTLLNKY